MPDANVNTPCSAYLKMSPRWTLLHDLLGGTDAMRAAGTRWLPRESREDEAAYLIRLSRSFLYGGFSNTVERLVSKPFSRPVTMVGDLPEVLEDLPYNMDLQGNGITSFGREVFEAAIVYGLTHILVDFPTTSTRSLAEEREQGIRPIMVHVSPPDLLGWRFEKRPNGSRQLTEIRIRERVTEPVSSFGDEVVNYVRVITKDTWYLYKEQKDGTSSVRWVLKEKGEHTFGRVPLVTYYIRQTGFMTADPPLMDLAWLNVAHWQSLSDQRNVLRFTRAGVLVATGFNDDELTSVVVGPNQLIKSANKDAKVQYAEHNGKALEAGQKDIESLEERMEVLGLQPLLARTSNATATGKVMDESRTQSSIQAWIRNCEQALERCFELAAEWAKTTLPDDLAVDIFNDFSLSLKATEDIDRLITMLDKNQITHETFLREVKRRGLLSDDVSVDDELNQLAAVAPVMVDGGAAMDFGDE